MTTAVVFFQTMKLFVVVVFCICIIHGYPDKRPVITVEEVSSEETEIELDHPWTWLVVFEASN